MGNVKAKMHYKGDKTGEKSFGVLLHGDAAFAGQGIVYESMQFAGLENYGTGGTIHIVANNQVGFTTDPWDSRTTQHPSDIGKGFDAPIFHVNADDPEAVCRVMKLAYDYRWVGWGWEGRMEGGREGGTEGWREGGGEGGRRVRREEGRGRWHVRTSWKGVGRSARAREPKWGILSRR